MSGRGDNRIGIEHDEWVDPRSNWNPPTCAAAGYEEFIRSSIIITGYELGIPSTRLNKP